MDSDYLDELHQLEKEAGGALAKTTRKKKKPSKDGTNPTQAPNK